MEKDSHKKSALKSLVWRIFGVFWLAMITYIFTRDWIQTGWITVLHHGIFLFVFYAHEQIYEHLEKVKDWLWIKKGTKARRIIKSLTYEILIANIILGTIVYFVTGDVKTMGAVTLTYTISKLFIYYGYEKLTKH